VTTTDAPPTIAWHPITPRFGAEIRTEQLHTLDDAGVEQLTHLIAERGVVVARRQAMDIDEQIALGRRLGPLHVHPAYADRERPEVLVIHADANSTHAAGEAWHSDVSCEPRPPAISMLRMETVPESGGDTLFADMYQAYQSLSPAMQDFLLGLTARHQSPTYFAASPTAGELPVATHPVVRTHPVTGRRALYVNSGFTKRIVELRSRESDALLKMLYDHIAYEVVNQIRVHWEPNTAVLWDNRCVQHHAAFDYFPAVRHGYRVTTIGEVPTLEPRS
jgi:taurine dioxygenase